VSDERKRQLLRQAVELLGRKELAKALGVGESTVESWVKGDEQMPQRQLRPLADALVKFASATKP
jgi:hypothetical protein